MNIATMSIGYIDLPNTTSLNVFAQGCHHNCSGCSNPGLRSFTTDFSTYLTNAQFIDELIRVKPLVNWIIWLGGDAVYQPSRLLELTSIAFRCGFHNCIYTGFDFASRDVQRILDHTDLVIDGKWEGIPVTKPNTNQRIYIRDDKTNKFIETYWHTGELYEAIKNK
jgi:pyruvate-formate lyase-activating enzyme